FEVVSFSGDKIYFSRKKILPILLLAILAGAVLYVLLTAMAALGGEAGFGNWRNYVLRLNDCIGIEQMPVLYAVQEAIGSWGVFFLGLAVVAALSSSMLGFFRVASKLSCHLAQEGILPNILAKKSEFGTAKNAVYFIVLLSIGAPFLGRTAIGWMTDVTTLCVSIVYMYVSFSAWVLGKSQRNVLFMITGLIGSVVSVVNFFFLLVPEFWNMTALAGETYLLLAIWIMLGFCFFRISIWSDIRYRFGRSAIMWVMMLFLFFFSSGMWARQRLFDFTESSINEINTYYTKKWESMGYGAENEESYAERMIIKGYKGKIRLEIMRSSVFLLILVVSSLVIMFSIFSAMREREKKMEIQRMKAEERSKAKSIFLSNMSHDIRTPMNAILGYTQLALKPHTSKETIFSYLQKIDRSSQHLLALVNDILEMSRIESGKMDLLYAAENLEHIMDEIHDMFATQMKSKQITFTVTVNIENKWVSLDRNRFNRVLLNLLSNAFKFTPQNGSVQVVLRQEGMKNDLAEYVLMVKDSGIGMENNFAQKIFEPFERERTSTVSGIQGTGLGMSITKSIVDLMGGTIEVE
ncbi:MAG: amino acid permease, partial [Desulfovibrio sp.]|nr:amino acid permease [Desulfovibrio sp.]